jgi:ABC-type Na+ efflux pump permease subunit
MDNSPEIIQKLKTSKQQGLSYYQATQALKAAGYSDSAIAKAADEFDYAAASQAAEPAGPLSADSPADPIAKQNIAQSLVNEATEETNETYKASHRPQPYSSAGGRMLWIPEGVDSWWPIGAIIVFFVIFFIAVFKYHFK